MQTWLWTRRTCDTMCHIARVGYFILGAGHVRLMRPSVMVGRDGLVWTAYACRVADDCIVDGRQSICCMRAGQSSKLLINKKYKLHDGRCGQECRRRAFLHGNSI